MCVYVRVHAHVYVLYYGEGGGVGGSILVRIHILFLKGADVIDLQFTDFPPRPSREIWSGDVSRRPEGPERRWSLTLERNSYCTANHE